ncbi:hypothetical protein SH449x_002764 [Pirellulaceae bacterium SH449]
MSAPILRRNLQTNRLPNRITWVVSSNLISVCKDGVAQWGEQCLERSDFHFVSQFPRTSRIEASH